MALIRLLGLLIAALWREVAGGIGALALLAAFLIGFAVLRARFLAAPICAGFFFARAAPYWLDMFWPDMFRRGGLMNYADTANDAGKVDHALSHWVFALLIYGLLCAIGYVAGRIARRLR